jgi:hypothetical protein
MSVVAEPSNFDLALQIATLSGKLDALIQTTTLQIETMKTRMDGSLEDQRDIHRELANRVAGADKEHDDIWKAIRNLNGWRNKIVGGGAVIGFLAVAANILIAVYSVTRPH